MKKIMKILFLNGMFLLSLGRSVFAAEGDSPNIAKIFFIGIAIIAISSILYLSYKSDNRAKEKGYDKPKKAAKKKDTIQEELVEKDTTYEVEDDEFYMDDKIDPVKVAKDEDEVSLFESINNPDTLTEEPEELSSFSTNVNVEESSDVIEPEEDKENFDGTMVFDFNSLKEDGAEEVVDVEMLNLEDEVEETESEEEPETNENEEFDYDYSDIEEEIREEHEEIEDEVVDTLLNETNNIEEELEEAEEEAKEANEGFSGFSTLGSTTKSKNKLTFERYSDTVKKEEKAEEPKKVQKVEEKIEEKIEDSSNDFLAQMEQNLSGGNVEKVEEKKQAKKTSTKKAGTTAKKSTTKKSTTSKKTTTTKKTTKTTKK